MAGQLPEWIISQRRARCECERCGHRAATEWAGTGELLCWACCESRQAEHSAWRDGYLYGKRDGAEGAPYVPRGDAEAYGLGFRWGERHPATMHAGPVTS